jgi:hypothetical protein
MVAMRRAASNTKPDHYPPGWAEWMRLVKKRHRPKDLGFTCGFVELNRFAHRYRLARSFRGISLDSFGSDTSAGYGGLLAVFLMWSAFEQFLKISGVRQSLYHPDEAAYAREFIVEAVTAEDPAFRFYSMIAAKSNADVRHELDAFMAGETFNVTYLASSIRHIFAHGFLTPAANKSRPGAVVAITSLFNDAHFSILDFEFGRRVAALL